MSEKLAIYRVYNKIFFNEDISDESIGLVQKLMAEYLSENINSKHVEPIIIYLNTYGGIVTSSLAIYDYIKSFPIPVYTVVNGACFSAGIVFVLAGKVRLAYPNSFFLIHETSYYEGYKMLHKHEQEVEDTKKIMDKVNQIILKETKIKKKDLNKFNKEEYLFDAKEALKLGIVQAVGVK